MSKKPKLELSTVKVIVPTTYDLVHWPDGCSQVPTYKQLLDTLAVVSTVLDMKEAGEEVPSELNKAVISWLLLNDVDKFEKAAIDAERHQRIVDECVTDNLVFPFPMSKYKGGH